MEGIGEMAIECEKTGGGSREQEEEIVTTKAWHTVKEFQNLDRFFINVRDHTHGDE